MNLIYQLYALGCPRPQIVTLREFVTMPNDAFYDLYSDIHLLTILKLMPFKTLLDVNAHFAKSNTLTRGTNDLTEIDCVCAEKFFPIKENIYRRVYRDFSECQFKHYDLALVYVNSPRDFDNAFFSLEDTSDRVITFAKYGSELGKHIRATIKNFAKVDVVYGISGEWLICYRHKPPEDFAMYVVTHKKLPEEFVKNFPADYKMIHAGRALNSDLGYIGDNTGDNLSHLNPYINEMTALYWMWKNTNEPIIGLSHYRRFFTALTEKENPLEFRDFEFSHEKILTKEQALKILEDFDIITTKIAHRHAPWYEDLGDIEELAHFALSITRKHLQRAQPDYIDAFDYVGNVSFFYCKSMFVTRRNIFDAYCKWLFSFYIDATREVLNSDLYLKHEANNKRLMGFISERLMTIWLIKNRLRIKELYIMELLNL